MKPSWLMVEYASTRLMSSWASAHVAAKTAVNNPTTATTVSATPETSKTGCMRTTRYTPAVTMVAAWMSAETGVGPAIASGSQTCSGTCADLPAAPANSRSAIHVAVPLDSLPALPSTWPISSVPSFVARKARPSSMAVSPTRVVRNAFFAALAASGRSNQNPINR